MTDALLLIDGTCGFCRLWSTRIDAFLQRLGGRPVRILPASEVDLDALGVPVGQTVREVVLHLPDGRNYGGAQAFAQWLIHAGGPVRPAGRALRLPGLRQLAQLLYRLIAVNRYRLPGSTEACALGVTGAESVQPMSRLNTTP